MPVQPPPQGGPVGLTPEVQGQIAAEVQRQIGVENDEAQKSAANTEINPGSSGIERMMADGASHVFLVASNMDLTSPAGQECSVTPGDVLQLQAPPAPSATSANLRVLASKGGQECQKSSIVTVAMNDLQDMQNRMREGIDQGLGELQKHQAKGLPAPPQSATGSTDAPWAAQGVVPPAEPNLAAELQQQAAEADAAEHDAGVQANNMLTPGGGKAPVEISLGQTVQQITANFGQPRSTVNLGARQIYVYPDMKVTFSAGRVVDVQ
jgi:hypothetical protein